MDKNKNDGFPENYHILPTPLEIIKGIGHFIKEACSMHLLSEHSDHFQHPLDEPIQPVTHIHGDETRTR